MLSTICTILLMMLFLKILGLAIKLSFGFLKIVLYVILFPGIILALIFGGFFVVALPLIIIGGLISFAVGA